MGDKMSKNATMFNNAFVNSGRFLMLPPSTKLLYFYLLKDADDDGIVDGYATIRILNAEMTDWTSLIERRFILLLDEPFLGFLPDYILHNQNFDLRYKKDSRYLPLLAEKFPTAQVQVGIKNRKGKIEKCVMKVAEYLDYSQKSQESQLLVQKSQNTRDSHGNSRFPTANITQHNKTQTNINKEKVTQLNNNIVQQNLIGQKPSNSDEHSFATICDFNFFSR